MEDGQRPWTQKLAENGVEERKEFESWRIATRKVLGRTQPERQHGGLAVPGEPFRTGLGPKRAKGKP